ncbi:MAG TPA: TetR/AcrR family transcriptional regulator [Anaeromyxobacter sp.]|nr:TetR/AcrR family transcriptional regulator [Anaeromyxobacter sp.]
MDGSVANRRIGPPRPGIAERIWDAARTEFSKRGYHGARVQGIARGASCNVALIYRHWASKRALYLDILRSVWLAAAGEIAQLVESGPGGPDAVVGAYLDAMMKDPMGAQILVREYLDGAPFLSQLTAAEPSLLEPVQRAAALLAGEAEGRATDPVLAVVTVGGLAALVASAQEAVRPFVSVPLPPETWRAHVLHLLTHGVGTGRGNGSPALHP